MFAVTIILELQIKKMILNLETFKKDLGVLQGLLTNKLLKQRPDEALKIDNILYLKQDCTLEF